MEYLIRVDGHLDREWQAWFAPLSIRHEAAGTTVLTGPLPDQAALYGVLLKINRLGLSLLTLSAAAPPCTAPKALGELHHGGWHEPNQNDA